MIPRLGCLFIVVPLIELALLIQVGRWIGMWPTVGLVAATGLLGMVLVRQEGLRTMARIQNELARGALPHRALMDGACILVGGAFLMTPGVITDALALALLFTPSRRFVQGWALKRLRRALEQGTLNVQVYGRWPSGASGDRVDREDEEGDGDTTRGSRPGEIIQD